MMLALTLLPFLLFITSFAAPSSRQTDCIPPQALLLPTVSRCQATINPPVEKLQFVTMGVGYQNYTCSDQGSYTSIGDFTYLYDISPIYTPSSPLFYNVQNFAFADWLNYHDPRQIAFDYGIEIVGQYYFQNSTNGLTPVWNLTQTYGPNAIAFAMVVGDFSSPDSPLPDLDGNVDWLYLTVTSGDLAQDVLRFYTNGREPPNQCSPGSRSISVEFTAQYWLYGGTTGTC